MDFFKFKSTGEATLLQQGEQINGIDKSLWVERYREPGEFLFEAKLGSDLLDFLPLGTLISHANTLDIMMVENHEIEEKKDEESIIKISGRSFFAYLENRITGQNQVRLSNLVGRYTMPADYTWNQILFIVNDAIGNTTYTDDNLSAVVMAHSIVGTADSVERTIEPGTVLERVMELLKYDDLGVRTIRRNNFGIGSSTNTTYLVHAGVNRSADVILTWQGGDVEAMKYLFSNQTAKNSAMVVGTYIWKAVDTGPTKYARRIMLVDGKDIDGHYDAVPTGFELAVVEALLIARGNQAIKAQRQFTIDQADVGENSKYQFRRHYDIGDLVSVAGNFGQIAVMRVVEFAEVQDENGLSGHPTLEIIGA